MSRRKKLCALPTKSYWPPWTRRKPDLPCLLSGKWSMGSLVTQGLGAGTLSGKQETNCHVEWSELMITLKHLTVERFRLLREINLHFPQRGSILIEGPNEAGKTALLESIYFALYGIPMASSTTGTTGTIDHNRSSIDDLVLYGSSRANVALTLSIGAT